MKFLHTSDWHLGKMFHEKSLLEDQEYVLNQILDVLINAEKKGKPYAALVVSGDIYDRAMPPAQATNLLNNFLVKATVSLPNLHIFMNSGNHDNSTRLSFCAELLEKHKIHLATDTKKITDPVIVEQAQEKVAFYQLPFLTPFSVSPDSSDFSQNSQGICRTQQELYNAACAKIIKTHKEKFADLPCVLNAHLYTLGSIPGNSERTNIGTAEQVDVSVFKDFTYGAFGHIHKYQICDKEKRCYYSGALLAYNFDDSPKTCMLDVELKSLNEKPLVKQIPFKPLHQISKITTKMENLIGTKTDFALINENKNNYVQVILTDNVMPTEAFANLKTVFPYLMMVTLKQQISERKNLSIQQRKEAINSHNPEKIFNQFIKDVYGDVSDKDSLDFFDEQRKIFTQEAANVEKTRG